MQRYEYFVIYANACSKKQAWVVAHACIFMDNPVDYSTTVPSTLYLTPFLITYT